ncbi:MAG: hypothetical protein RR138_07820, partial [Akkermansia sp.]
LCAKIGDKKEAQKMGKIRECLILIQNHKQTHGAYESMGITCSKELKRIYNPMFFPKISYFEAFSTGLKISTINLI